MTRSADAGVIATDKGDRAVGEGDIDAAAIAMLPGRLVPGDDPVGIFDDGRGHRTLFVPVFLNEITSGRTPARRGA